MTDETPVRLIKRKHGCANRLIEVYLDDIEGPMGEIINDFVVLSPRQKSENNVTGVAILPILDGNLGLLKIYRHPIREYTWEVPRGFVDAGEKVICSALRELEEETGLQCESTDVIDLGTVLPEPGIMAARTHLFAATQCRRMVPYTANELGHKEMRFFSAEEFSDMARRGTIEDANTLVAYYRYFLRHP
jgi:ADP-ribose pyrophosphatase